MEIRRSYDRLISTMELPTLVRRHIYILSGSCTLFRNDDAYHIDDVEASQEIESCWVHGIRHTPHKRTHIYIYIFVILFHILSKNIPNRLTYGLCIHRHMCIILSWRAEIHVHVLEYIFAIKLTWFHLWNIYPFLFPSLFPVVKLHYNPCHNTLTSMPSFER